MFKINTNTQSLTAQRYLGNVVRTEAEEQTKLASGSRVYQSAFDPSGLAIATGMKAKSISNMQAQRNVNDGVSLLQVAEGTLGVMHDISGRLRELAMQSANDTVGENERIIANMEFKQLTGELKRLTASTKFNGNHIINGSGSVYDLQIGIGNEPGADRIRYDLQKVLASKDNFGLDSQNILTKEGARASFSKLDSMRDEVSSSRAKIGASMNRMSSSLTNLQIHRENLESSKSKIMDVDVAKAVSNSTKAGIMKNVMTSVLSQANTKPALANKLIG